MKLLSRIFTATKKTKLAVVAVTTLAIIAGSAAVFAGFGPERMVFDWNNNPGTCDLAANRGDRCGSITPVFNSFINTPSYGDERNFARIAEVVPGQAPTHADYAETKTATPGKEYWVRTLVHNDANQNMNCSPEHRDPATNDCTQIDPGSPGIATNTRVKLEIAEGVANGVDVMTKVSADNATPQTVWDTATLANETQGFSVSYVNGSAVLYNQVFTSGTPLSDAINSSTGVQVGYDQMNGSMPGCFEYAAYVYVKVKVQAPALKFDKLVRFAGEGSDKWRQSLAAKKGDRVQYLLDYLNTGSATVNNIVIRDKLPTNMALVPGTVKWIDINHPAPGASVPDTFLFADAGVLLGNYGVNGGGYIMFDATVKNDAEVCTATNVAYVRGDDVPEQNNDAVVTITDCQTVQPAYRCDLLTVTRIGERKYSYKVNYTATNGATLKSYTYNFGDGSTPLTTDKNPVEYTYQKDGTYVSKVTVNFSVKGVDKSHTAAACEKQITINKENCPIPGKGHLPKDSPDCKVVTPVATTPTALPNTGAGDVVGIFTGVSLAGSLAHRFITGRRYR